MPQILDLKTNLKSLKYGQDQPGGGNSGQPYIQNNINNPKDILGFDDGLIRGGAVGAARASSKDSIRIGKWLKDFPKGPLWIVKQTGLQRSNPRLESPIIPLFPAEPTRYYNFGSNTLTQIPVNAFGIHFDRHGLLPIQPANTKYLAVAQANNKNFGANNRLVKLKNQLIDSGASAPPSFVTKLLGKARDFLNANLNLKIPTPGLTIYDYNGGPGSVYGLGRTLIKRYNNTTTGIANKIPILNAAGGQNIIENYKYATPISNEYGINSDTAVLNQTVIPYMSNIPAGYYSGPSSGYSPTLRSYFDLKKVINKQTTAVNNPKAIFKYNNAKDKKNLKYNSNTEAYTNNKISYNNGNTTININGTWSSFNRGNRIGSGKTDSINLTPILTNVSSVNTSDKIGKYDIRDLVNLRILALNGDDLSKDQNIHSLMAFRAYITQFSDNTDAKWTPVQYIGRGEEFYTYTGFGRKVQIGFKVAALSSDEMQPIYEKLNFLMGNLMPDYKNGLMRGPLVKMTVGNWLNNQDGILNSLSYTIPNDSPWEIAIDEPEQGSAEKLLVLPHVVEVQMQFTPIGSQTKGENKISSKSTKISHIAQNVNDYQYIK